MNKLFILLALCVSCYGVTSTYEIQGVKTYGEVFRVLKSFRPLSFSGSAGLDKVSRPWSISVNTYPELIRAITENANSDGFRIIVKGNSFYITESRSGLFDFNAQNSTSENYSENSSRSYSSSSGSSSPAPVRYVTKKDTVFIKPTLAAEPKQPGDTALQVYTIQVVAKIISRVQGFGVSLPEKISVDFSPPFYSVSPFSASVIATKKTDTTTILYNLTASGRASEPLSVVTGNEIRREKISLANEQNNTTKIEYDYLYNGLSINILAGVSTLEYRQGATVLQSSARVGAPLSVSGLVESVSRGFFTRSRVYDYIEISVLYLPQKGAETEAKKEVKKEG